MGPVNVLALYMIDIDKNGIDIKHLTVKILMLPAMLSSCDEYLFLLKYSMYISKYGGAYLKFGTVSYLSLLLSNKYVI